MGLLDAILKRKPAQPGIEPHDLTQPYPVPEVTRVIGERRYSSMDAKNIAQGIVGLMAYGWLMQTNKGSFFLVSQAFVGVLTGPVFIAVIENNSDVKKYYEKMGLQLVSHEVIFPHDKIIDA